MTFYSSRCTTDSRSSTTAQGASTATTPQQVTELQAGRTTVKQRPGTIDHCRWYMTVHYGRQSRAPPTAFNQLHEADLRRCCPLWRRRGPRRRSYRRPNHGSRVYNERHQRRRCAQGHHHAEWGSHAADSQSYERTMRNKRGLKAKHTTTATKHNIHDRWQERLTEERMRAAIFFFQHVVLRTARKTEREKSRTPN